MKVTCHQGTSFEIVSEIPFARVAVDIIRRQVKELMRIEIHQVRLIVKNQLMEDGELLGKYGAKDGGTIFAVLGLGGGGDDGEISSDDDKEEDNEDDEEGDESFDLAMSQEEDNDSSRFESSQVSSLTTHRDFSFTKGSHGQLIRTQQHPKSKKSDKEKQNIQVTKFAATFFNGSTADAVENIRLFHGSIPAVADGILAGHIMRKNGLTQYMARSVFGIGEPRYNRIKGGSAAQKKKGGNWRKDAVTDVMLDQIRRMLDPDNDDGLPVELGFACAHGRQGKNAVVATKWDDVYAHYVNFELNAGITKMAQNTLYRYVKVIERDFHLKRTTTDACDVCERIRVELLEAGLTDVERQLIEVELLDHQQATRTQRKGLKEFIKMWGRKEGVGIVDDVKAWDEAVDRLPDEFDEHSAVQAPAAALGNCRALLLCEDYAGNFPMPWYGDVVPGSDYYQSKLHLYCFIVSNMNTGRNKAYCYDQRGMGKGADALCSLRFYNELAMYIGHRDAGTLAQRPRVLVTVRDNCVGQNKSKAVMAFCTLLNLLFYDRIVVHFLGRGHSHMRPDQVVAWLKKTLNKQQVYSPVDMVKLFNTLDCVEAEFFDYNDLDNPMPLWGGWEALMKAVGIKNIPSIGKIFSTIPVYHSFSYTNIYLCFIQVRVGTRGMGSSNSAWAMSRCARRT